MDIHSIIIPVLLLGIWRPRMPSNEVTYLRARSVGERAGILMYMPLTIILDYHL